MKRGEVVKVKKEEEEMEEEEEEEEVKEEEAMGAEQCLSQRLAN